MDDLTLREVEIILISLDETEAVINAARKVKLPDEDSSMGAFFSVTGIHDAVLKIRRDAENKLDEIVLLKAKLTLIKRRLSKAEKDQLLDEAQRASEEA